MPADLSRFQVFDQLAGLVAVVHSDGHFALVNAALEAVLGRPQHSLRQARLQHYLQDTSDFEPPYVRQSRLAQVH